MKEALGLGLERNGSDDYLMVQSSKSSTNEWTNPEDPLQTQTQRRINQSKSGISKFDQNSNSCNCFPHPKDSDV